MIIMTVSRLSCRERRQLVAIVYYTNVTRHKKPADMMNTINLKHLHIPCFFKFHYHLNPSLLRFNIKREIFRKMNSYHMLVVQGLDLIRVGKQGLVNRPLPSSTEWI